ncbi:recombinase family protein [Deinococcus caeni]|uniref:Recombinase domain-containing protein n=1 Tax=Deinococcus caeni TaxID=569127 RepID=A0ABP9UIZ0_9DEIO
MNETLYQDSLPIICQMRSEGHTYQAIVNRLHELQILPPGGGHWHMASVRRVWLKAQPEQSG